MSRLSRWLRNSRIGLLLASLVATLAFTGAGVAYATGGGHPPPPDDDTKCTYLWERDIPQSHQEYEYKKKVVDKKTQWYFVKYTRTKTRTWVEGTPASPDRWWVWAPSDTQGPQDYEPDFPDDPRGKWVGPKENGGPEQGTYGTFQTRPPGNSNWFHREKGEDGTDGHWTDWTDWSEWTRWVPDTHTSWQDNNVEALGSPAFHASGTYPDGTEWYREWQARNTGETREVVTGSHWEYSGWVTEKLGSPWILVRERTVDDEPLHQGPVRSADEPDRGEYKDVPWTKIPGSEECPPKVIEIPAAPSVNDPCGPDNASWNVPADTDEVSWKLREDGHLIAMANEGYVFKGGETKYDYGTAPDSGEKCPPNVVPLPEPQVMDPCGPYNAEWIVPADTDEVTWKLDLENGHLWAYTTEGNAFEDGTTSHDFGVAPDSREACPPTHSGAKVDTSSRCGVAIFANNGMVGLPFETNVGNFFLKPGDSKRIETDRHRVTWSTHREKGGVIYSGEGSFSVRQDCGSDSDTPGGYVPPETGADGSLQLNLVALLAIGLVLLSAFLGLGLYANRRRFIS